MYDRNTPPRTVTLSHHTDVASYLLVGDPRPAAGLQSVVSIPAGANITSRNVFQLVLSVKKASGQPNSRANLRVATALVSD